MPWPDSSAGIERRLRESRRASATPPPDYSKRSTHLRLFFWVAAVALTVMFVSRIRDPSIRYLLGLEDRPIANGPPLTEQEIARESVDTHLGIVPAPDAAGPQAGAAAENSDGEPELENPDEPPERWGVADSDSPRELTAATLDAWAQIIGQLSGDEQLLLYAALDAVQADRRLDPTDAAAWRTLLDRLYRDWKTYVRKARGALDTLPEAEQATWQQRLDTLESLWPKYWQPLLETWIAEKQPASESSPEKPPADQSAPTSDLDADRPEPLAENVRPIATRLEKILDAIALAAVKDDTVARPAEKAIWFRLLTKLRDTPPEKLAELSLGPTGYLPLLKQPRDYRGKVVLVRGVARQAYRVDAPKNRPGIPGYYLFWVNPSGGPNSPIVAYALETPPGFPPIADRAQGPTELHEEVAFEGYFFKRWAYSAQDGVRVAPLVLARMPHWQAPPAEDKASTPWLAIALIVALAAVVGITLGVVIMRKASG